MKKTLLLKSIGAGLVFMGALNLFALAPLAPVPAVPGNLPLFFEANPDQASGPVQFLTCGCNYQFLLSPTEVQIALGKTGVKPAEVRMNFARANPEAQMSGATGLPGKINYLIGNNPAQWHTGVATFARVQVEQLYPGINLVYYGNQRQLEYDFSIAPGTDPGAIEIQFSGVDKISIDARGQLILAVSGGGICQPAPAIYQMVGGQRRAIRGGYRLVDAHTVAFTIGKYDQKLRLVIDPILSFSTYFGGNSSDAAWAVALDTNGFIYVAGQTLSKQMSATNAAPFSTPGAFQTNFAGGSTAGDAFVAKFDNQGSNLIYLTYLGGSVNDVALSLAVDNAGNAFVAGYTDSPNFPVTPGAIHTNISGVPDQYVHLYPTDGFVAELNPGGSNLVYSTYLGGEQADGVYSIAVDSADNAYVTGFTCSTNFPTTNALPFQLVGTTNMSLNHLACPYSYYFNNNAFVAEIASNGTSLKFSSYLGGTNYDWGNSIAVDASNYIYVTGYTASTNFPTTNAIYQRFVSVTLTNNSVVTNQVFTTNFFNGYLLNGASNQISPPAYDAFVTKLAPGGTGWVYSTFLGGTNNDIANHIAVDGAGNAYVTGWTVSTNFPNTVTITNLYNGLTNNLVYGYSITTNAFLAQITWNGTNAAIGYSTVFGGTNFGIDVGYGVTLDPYGNIFVVGAASTTNFPAVNTPGLLGPTNAGGSDVFVIAFSTNCSAILYSGYLGGSGNDYGYGIAVDSQTNVYIAGQTASVNFPVFNARQSSLDGPSDAFLAKIGWGVVPPEITDQSSLTNQLVETGSQVTFAVTATGTPPLSYQWQLNGTNLANGTNIFGATNNTLTIYPAATNDTGTYQVIVTNYAGSVTSTSAVLTVTSGPIITVQPTNETVGVGDTAQFSVNGNAQPPVHLQWVKDGADLTDGTNASGSVISGSTNSGTLTIDNVQTNDAGNYWLVVTNNYGSVTSDVATLTVDTFPTILVNPTNQTVAQNSTVTFVVNAVGTEPLSYQWQANGVNLLNGGRISGATNSTLTVSGVLTGDAKSYSVIVTNNIGSVTSSPPAVLMVLTSPLFSSIATDTNGNFVLSGIGNVSGNTYYVLASTNLATPLAEWTPIATNYFGSQGQFIFTNIPPTNTPQQFYILQSQ